MHLPTLRGCSSVRVKNTIPNHSQLNRSQVHCSHNRCKDSKVHQVGALQSWVEAIQPNANSYDDNKPTIDIIASQKPTEQTRHINICFFAIQDWIHKSKDIQLSHILPGVIYPLDDLTKPLGRVLHKCRARYIMGHYNTI